MTPTGLLAVGDVIRSPGGHLFRVIERLGNDELYSVRLVPADHHPLPLSRRSKGHVLLVSAGYQITHGWEVVEGLRPLSPPTLTELLNILRGAGWSVAVHNDYKLEGKSRTFWLLTHPSGQWAKGEGDTDVEALVEIMGQLVPLERTVERKG